MKKILLCGLLWSLPFAALAAYKCDHKGAVTFSDKPCTAGTQTIVEAGPGPSAADTRAAQRQIDQEKKKVKALETARHKREAVEDKARLQADRRADAMRKNCAKLDRRIKSAEEDARQATRISAIERAKSKSRRMKAQYAQECAR